MSISKETLTEEREKLQGEFDTVRKEIMQLETQLGQMRSNLNAINGAIQQTNRILGMVEGEKKDGKEV